MNQSQSDKRTIQQALDDAEHSAKSLIAHLSENRHPDFQTVSSVCLSLVHATRELQTRQHRLAGRLATIEAALRLQTSPDQGAR